MKNAVLIPYLMVSTLIAETTILSHQLEVHLDPATHHLAATDAFDAEFSGYLEFYLGKDFTISNLQVNGKAVRVKTIPSDTEHSRLMHYRVRQPRKKSGRAEVTLSYEGQRFEDTGAASFSREKIAMEITGTISEEGIFLAPSSGFYPAADEGLVLFETNIHLPPGWDAVSEGSRTADKTAEASVLTYRTAHPVDGIHITASRWAVNRRDVDGVEFYTFFFPEDTSLARQYLEMSIRYVQMYTQLISPYPFSKFAVVENFFPTGYGMPSYTVLGRTVVRLPFIVYTSLGHEVLHNWWGNSVYIGAGGNWCEGLTTYQADYLYKLQSDADAARQYRKDILKDYTVYADEGSDFPPAGFTRRSDMSTRAVGYGKVAMIFHMLEEHIGQAAFLEALREVVRDHQWTEASWNDFFTAFQHTSSEDLSAFQAAWVNAAGAPLIELMDLDGSFSIKQSGVVKPLWIPVRLAYADGTANTEIVFSDRELVELTPRSFDNLVEVAVDPDYHLMRRLHESELDATLRNILSQSSLAFVIPEKSSEWADLARAFLEALPEDGELLLRTPAEPLDAPAVIYLGTLPEDLSAPVIEGSFEVDGQAFEANTHALVWAFKSLNGRPGLVVHSSNIEELSALPRKLPHYGKYGYLVFQGGENVLKGNHTTKESLLIWKKK